MIKPEEHFANIHAVLDKIAARQDEMAAQQAYHDAAFERMDAEIKEVLETAKQHNVSIQALIVGC